jgi:hypothetical protein
VGEMNILDIEEKDKEEFLKKFKSRDKLDIIFEIANYLKNKYGVKDLELETKEGQEQIRKYIYFMLEEIFEFANLLKHRPWTKSNYDLDINRIYDEIADAFAFFLEILLLLKIDSNKLFDIYVRKMIVNEFRINSNY